jgi:CRP-like cAMP-binding protein
LKHIVIPKKEFVQRQDELCQNLFFVDTGMLRAFHINKKGKEITVMFAASDWWITDMNGFLNLEKSMVNIVALE